MAQAKQFVAESKVQEALDCYKAAYQIEPSEKLRRRMDRMQVRFLNIKLFVSFCVDTCMLGHVQTSFEKFLIMPS